MTLRIAADLDLDDDFATEGVAVIVDPLAVVAFDGMLLGVGEIAWALERLRARTEVRDGCWIWTGYTKNGYGALSIRSHVRYIHRLSLTLALGDEPIGLDACHRRDTRPCWNPSHLFAGTRQDNVADAKAKGRATDPPRNDGERHHLARLTDDEVAAIRRSAGAPQRDLARAYGVSQSTVWRILHEVVRP